MKKGKQHILVVCHDAGGAEVVSAYVKKHADIYIPTCVVDGPAKKIFKRKGLSTYCISVSKGKKIKQNNTYTMLLCGTSGASNLERDFILAAQRVGLRSVAYLDHWVNYRERFGYPHAHWKKNLPHELWVGDTAAYARAQKEFKNSKIVLVPNEYYKEIKKEYTERKKIQQSKGTILFISEPMHAARVAFHKRTSAIDEYVILENILKYLAKQKKKETLVIAYHPSEKKDKYDDIIKKFKPVVTIQKQSKDRISDLIDARLVIGIQSMALVIALMCGKKVVSYFPRVKKSFPLPYPKIKRITSLSALPL